MPIRILDAATVGRIAAGEVVERPASVAKELFENSLDAGATAITVEIRLGGIEYLRVTDNGRGIPPEEVRLAFQNHATSKLKTAEELTDIRTMGFRGEALASISAVSKVEITTRRRGADAGVKAVVEAGRFISVTQAGCPEGTTIVVKDLFFNTPVRKAFLKKPNYEAGAVIETVTKLLLGNPGVSVRMINAGKTLFHSFGDGNARHAVLAVYGKDVAQALIDVNAMLGGLRISGLIGVGDLGRPTRAQQSFYVNGRSIKCQMLCQALENAAKGRVTIGMHPMCVLNITLPAQSVDVNVHPSKLEVRFRDEESMRASIDSILATAFKDESIIDMQSVGNPNVDIGGKPRLTVENVDKGDKTETDEAVAAERANVKPENSDDIGNQADGGKPPYSTSKVDNDNIVSNAETEIDAFPRRSMSLRDGCDIRRMVSFDNSDNQNSAESPDLEARVPSAAPESENLTRRDALEASSKEDARLKYKCDASAETFPVTDYKRAAVKSNAVFETNETVNATNADMGDLGVEKPLYRLIGSAFDTYVLIQTEKALVMIDQHAAHERILYEKYCRMLDEGTASQRLLLPLVIEVSKKELAQIENSMDLITSAGFDIESFGDREIAIRAVPFVLGKAEIRPLFMEMLDRLDQLKYAESDRRRQEIMQMACKHAVKGSQALSDVEIAELIKAMTETQAPSTCPHGRPVMRVFNKVELDKMFKRIQ